MISNLDDEINEVLALVEKALSGNSKYQEIVDHGSLDVNCYSMTLWADFNGSNGRTSVYIKFPKIIFYDKNKSNNLSFSEKDRILSQDEFKSLQYLSQHWDNSHGINFVKPLAFVKQYNAIITERIENIFFFKYYRKYNLLSALASSKYNTISEYMYKIGISLRTFHNNRFQHSYFDYNILKPKINKYIEKLLDYKVNANYLKNAGKTLLDFEFQCTAKLVNNLKGIDIRQIFIDEKSHKLHIIDPGKITHGYAENDLARYIITTRVLYWGTFGTFLHLRPSPIFEKKFISGYYGNDSNSNTMLSLIIVKELFKHWIMAHSSLKNRVSNKVTRSFLGKFYIDRFYINLMNEELRRL
jgi:hypothetical protein